MPAVQEANPKPASAGAARRAATAVLRTPQAAAGWGKDHPRASAGIGFLVLALLAPLAAVWVLRPSPPEPKPITFARALEELDSGHDQEAREMAEQLQQSGQLAEDEIGGPAFVLGVATSRQADALEGQQQGRYSLLAARYLIESRDAGFPTDREFQGLQLLGKNLFRAGQYEASQEALEAALAVEEDGASEVHRMLCDVYLKDGPPRLQPALEHITRYLEDAQLPADAKSRAQLDRAAILLKLGRFADSRASLAALDATIASQAESQILSARIQMAEAAQLRTAAAAPLPPEAREKLEAAAASLAPLAAAEDGDQTAAAVYQYALCLQSLGKSEEARLQFDNLQERFAGSVEAVAAGLQQADALQAEGRDAEAIQRYKKLWKDYAASLHKHSWVMRDELRERALAAYQRYIDAGRFEQAVQLLAPLEVVLEPAVKLELSAAAHRSWAHALLATAETAGPTERLTQRRQAEKLFRTAGDDYARLAELRFTTRDYPDDLWASAECHLLAHQHSDARRALVKYLKEEPARRRALALVRIGECLLLEGDAEKALEHFDEAITTAPSDSAVYRGRTLASQAHLRLNAADAAEKLLMENLTSDLLTPASLEWRDSLFALGRLYFLTNRFPEALTRLDEAVRRYPQSPEAIDARYLIAESNRQLARRAMDQRDAALVESARSVHAREARTRLEASIAAYENTAKELEGSRELSEEQAAILRNCRYMKAAAQFDLGRYEESIKSYSTAINQYQKAPDVLDAYVRVADCFRRLNRPLEARGTIEQAKVVLSRLPTDANFAETSSLDRQEWQRYLQWLGGL